MSRLTYALFTCCALAACGDNLQPAAPDAPSTVPRDPGGSFAVRSELDLPLPAAASAAFQPLIDATNDPDDPSRYLLDRLVDELPAGTAQTIAREAVPLLAAYLNEHLAEFAPRLVAGLDTIAQGLPAVARHVGTSETWLVDPTGGATRIVTGVRFDVAGSPIDVVLAEHGLDDRVAMMHVGLDGAGDLAIGSHALPLGYSALVRLGLDHAVIPAADPGATDLGTALADLASCTQLGEMIAGEIDLDVPSVFAAACRAATDAIASDVYARIDAIDAAAPLQLELTGSARGIDLDHDGSMDQIESGAWSGSLGDVGPVGAATFTGARTP
ncbi:MAG TPA: hypothetical protein VGF94_18115 [Kofleriaceae bacterium]|jgi:hypothetical protein